MKLLSTATALSLVSSSFAWLPQEQPERTSAFKARLAPSRVHARALPYPSDKIRGVNLGSLFIIEPWMVTPTFQEMGCADENGNTDKSEFDCVLRLGQDEANRVFQNHWDTWFQQSELDEMKSYGLNTIRVPLGYWMDESLIRDSEKFPRGGIEYLDRLMGWASDAGMYVILDLHGGPGAQVALQPFTGQNNPNADFYNSDNYERAYQFLEFITERVHTKSEYRSVGMLEVINEPISGQDSMINEYYPTAYQRIRDREQSLNVATNETLHIQYMNTNWGSGSPTSNLPDGYTNVAFDAHIYPKFDPNQEATKDAYLARSCGENVASDGDTPVSVGEWSISVKDEVEDSSDFEVNSGNNDDFYKQWFAAQVMSYERANGWIFWNWKIEDGDDYRWSYRTAVEQGIVPKNIDEVYNMGAC